MNGLVLERRRWWPLLVIGVAWLAWHNSFHGPFVFDDLDSIVENPRIRQLSPIGAVLSGTSRPVVQLSLALNFAHGGLRVVGYHAVNFAVHVLAALVLMGLVRRTLLAERLGGRYADRAGLLAMAAALLWVVHPLQTESVTYVIQRGESLMGLCYLLTLYAVARSAVSPCPGPWLVAAVAACALGMASKPIMVTAPLAALIYDRVFLAGSWRQVFREHGKLYVGLAATWGLLAALLLKWPEGWERSAGFGFRALSPLEYAQTQPAVLVHYLQLAFWPRGLCLDYGWPAAHSAGEILPFALGIGVLVAATVWALVRRPAWGFVGAWFFLVLAPSSSVIPIADLAVEHRMYLPLAAVVVVAVIVGDALLRRVRAGLGLGVLGALVVTLGLLTYGRNEDYRSAIGLWTDTVASRPNNPRAYFNLGQAFEQAGDKPRALELYLRAQSMGPPPAPALLTIGSLLTQAGRHEEAAACFIEAFTGDPLVKGAHYNLGRVRSTQGRLDEAIAQFREELRRNPGHVKAHYHLAVVLNKLGRSDEAIQEYRHALALEPDHPQVHLDLGKALAQLRRPNEAIWHFNEALRLQPGWPEAFWELAAAQAQAGRFDAATQAATAALEFARAAGRADLVPLIEQRIAAYRARQISDRAGPSQ